MTFTTTPTADGGVYVTGTDDEGVDGKAVLRSDLWNQVKQYRAFKLADEEFNVTVEEFFGPLIEAAEARNSVLVKPKGFSTVTISEATEGVDAEPAFEIELDPQGTALRALDESRHNLLRWVGGTLIVLEA